MSQPGWSAEIFAWNNRAVVLMAERIKQTKDWSSLPILADALEEAGCTDVGCLGHLRQQTPHANDCWVLEELLKAAKEASCV